MASRPMRLAGALVSYARIAWWGIVAPRTPLERRALVIVQAVILRDGMRPQVPPHVLLAVRSDLMGWELPGGTVEPGEAFEDAIVREVLEETGIEVSVERHVGDYVRTGFRPHTARVFLCREVGGTPSLSDEILQVGYFAAGALPDELFPWYHGPLEDAFADHAEPVVRRERQGVRSIWAGLRIDLRMRLSTRVHAQVDEDDAG